MLIFKLLRKIESIESTFIITNTWLISFKKTLSVLSVIKRMSYSNKSINVSASRFAALKIEDDDEDERPSSTKSKNNINNANKPKNPNQKGNSSSATNQNQKSSAKNKTNKKVFQT